MPRKARIEEAALSEFGRWLLGHLRQRQMALGTLAQAAGIDESYLHKILKSYLPQYRQYRRPSYEKTVALGRCLGDVAGAVRAAGYSEGDPAGPSEAVPAAMPLVFTGGVPGSDSVPQNAEDWPPELLEAMHYSQSLTPEVQRYIYGLWREQARVYAALQESRREESRRGEVGPAAPERPVDGA